MAIETKIKHICHHCDYHQSFMTRYCISSLKRNFSDETYNSPLTVCWINCLWNEFWLQWYGMIYNPPIKQASYELWVRFVVKTCEKCGIPEYTALFENIVLIFKLVTSAKKDVFVTCWWGLKFSVIWRSRDCYWATDVSFVFNTSVFRLPVLRHPENEGKKLTPKRRKLFTNRYAIRRILSPHRRDNMKLPRNCCRQLCCYICIGNAFSALLRSRTVRINVHAVSKS